MNTAARQIDRRFFLAGSAAVAGVLSLPAAGSTIPVEGTRPLVLLLDPRRQAPRQAVESWRGAASQVLEIAGDPVRLWGSDAGQLLRDARARLVGFSTWPDLLVFRGLAAESRRHLRHEQQDVVTGVFSWLIA